MVSHFHHSPLAAPRIEMGQVSPWCQGGAQLAGVWAIVEGRAEISSWEVVKDARLGVVVAVSLQ